MYIFLKISVFEMNLVMSKSPRPLLLPGWQLVLLRTTVMIVRVCWSFLAIVLALTQLILIFNDDKLLASFTWTRKIYKIFFQRLIKNILNHIKMISRVYTHTWKWQYTHSRLLIFTKMLLKIFLEIRLFITKYVEWWSFVALRPCNFYKNKKIFAMVFSLPSLLLRVPEEFWKFFRLFSISILENRSGFYIGASTKL